MAATATAAITLTPEAVIALMNMAKKLLDKHRIRQTDFRENLEAVKMDLGIVNDVLRVINRRNRRNLADGIRNWQEEASRVVTNAGELLKRIEQKNPDSDPDSDNEEDDGPETTSWCLWFGGKKLRFSNQDANDLENLRTRLDNITKNNQTVLILLKGSRCNPL